MPDVDIHKSLFTFTPKYLQLSETTVNIGKNDLTADSRFENYLGYVLKGTTLKGTLNIRSNHLNLNDFMTTTADSAAQAETTPEATASIIEVPRNIDFQMDANLKEVLFDKMAFTDMNGKLIVKDSKVDMKNLSMNTMEETWSWNGYYSTTDSGKTGNECRFQTKCPEFCTSIQRIGYGTTTCTDLRKSERKLLRQHESTNGAGYLHESRIGNHAG